MSHARKTPSIAVALSGGVDSSVAAWRLLEAGHEVEAVFMKNWEEDDEPGYCAAAEDLADAERVCEQLGIGLRTVNFSYEYWEQVFSRFLDEQGRGRTPNPDVLCNREIKFDVFLDYALRDGAARLATGHYARSVELDGEIRLLKGHDPGKDQSYFLHLLGQAQLRRTLFPLGELCKREVRSLARRAGLPTSEKKDSTGLCFIGERPFKAFLRRFLDPPPGPIREVDGAVIGEHDGLPFYTSGQRKGLGLGGRREGTGQPWYVAGKDLATNTLLVAQGSDHPALYARRVHLADCHWVRGETPALPLACAGKTRYRQPDQACTVFPGGNGGATVDFERPQWAPAPGQSVVLYRGEECLGGGVIERVPGQAAPAR